MVRSFQPPVALDWSCAKLKILGVFISHGNLEEDNWRPRIDAVDHVLTSWRSRSLTFRGKALVINALALSRVWYVASLVHVPRWRRSFPVWSFPFSGLVGGNWCPALLWSSPTFSAGSLCKCEIQSFCPAWPVGEEVCLFALGLVFLHVFLVLIVFQCSPRNRAFLSFFFRSRGLAALLLVPLVRIASSKCFLFYPP